MEDLEDERAIKGSEFDDDPKQIVQMPAVERPRRTVPLNSLATDWAHLVPILRPVQKALLLVLARHADRYGCSWCSQKTLAAEAGCCDRTVRYVLKSFETRGLIRRIGRMGAHGGQLTDVVVLTDWPERTLIPETGHPKLGRTVKETSETRFQWTIARAQARAALPPGAATTPDQNKDRFISTTTIRADRILEAAFGAMGRWATAENMRHLADDVPTLLKWLKQGLDLDLHILPVLAEKAKKEGEIPLIRTWRYFEQAIRKAASRRRSPADGSHGCYPVTERPTGASSASDGPKDGQDGSA